MQFKTDVPVLTARGAEIVGQVEHLIVDPSTHEATHLVIRKGALFTEDKLIPVDWIEKAKEDRIVLRESIGILEDLPVFDEGNFSLLSEHTYVPGKAPA